MCQIIRESKTQAQFTKLSHCHLKIRLNTWEAEIADSRVPKKGWENERENENPAKRRRDQSNKISSRLECKYSKTNWMDTRTSKYFKTVYFAHDLIFFLTSHFIIAMLTCCLSLKSAKKISTFLSVLFAFPSVQMRIPRNVILARSSTEFVKKARCVETNCRWRRRATRTRSLHVSWTEQLLTKTF